MDVPTITAQPPSVVPPPAVTPTPPKTTSTVPWLWIGVGVLVVLVVMVGGIWWMNQTAVVDTESETMKAAEEPVVQPAVEEAEIVEETTNPLEVNPFAEEYENPFGEEESTDSDGANQNPF